LLLSPPARLLLGRGRVPRSTLLLRPLVIGGSHGSTLIPPTGHSLLIHLLLLPIRGAVARRAGRSFLLVLARAAEEPEGNAQDNDRQYDSADYTEF